MKYLILPVLFILCFITVLPAAADQDVFPVDREFYPYYPSLFKWEKSGAVFTEPQTCADCHDKQYKEWSGSVHSLALRDPVYQGELNKAVKAAGHDIGRQCEGCHSPAAMMNGELKKPGLAGLSSLALAGVSCDVCHSVSGTTHTRTPMKVPENGSLILNPGYDGKDGAQLVKRGSLKPDTECGGGFHECIESPLHDQADLCAGCHQVYHYDKHFPIESTYNEWKQSPYAQKGIQCQDCHMVETETFLKSSTDFRKPERSDYRHYFSGVNYLLAYLSAQSATRGGDKEQAARSMQQYDMAIKRLQSAAGLEIVPLYSDGELRELKIKVSNLRAGHNLPTSLTNIRQMWLEITAKDQNGKVVMSSGSLETDGSLSPETRVFNSDGMGSNFHFAADPWVITAFSRHETIPPRGFKEVYYGVGNLKKTKYLTVEVKLRYRTADQRVAEALLAAVPKDIDLAKEYGLNSVPQLPVVDMVSTQLKVPVRNKK
ncbi:MAG: multiheme c-type cytochrome [Desulfuromonadaceae bacterium]|nr:multiheme c-type cytochrome [Desulfuromonadaceae bacterium]MDD2856051.1 multiheme c-type cytochrome [Desulfuromonadaceae bacterium]